MRKIQCEGGPYDGVIMGISDTIDAFRIPLYGRIAAVPLDQITPRPSRYGTYRQDPLDRATFNWMGET